MRFKLNYDRCFSRLVKHSKRSIKSVRETTIPELTILCDLSIVLGIETGKQLKIEWEEDENFL
jgi:hypothetical protein